MLIFLKDLTIQTGDFLHFNFVLGTGKFRVPSNMEATPRTYRKPEPAMWFQMINKLLFLYM